MATPAAPPAHTAPDTTPTMCLKHADFHPMDGDCWSVTFDWYFAHSHLPEQAARDQYQSEVEQAMLDQHIQAHRAGLTGGDR